MDQSQIVPRRANPFGIASLIAGVLLLVISAVTQAISPAIPYLLAETGMSFRAIPFLISLPPAIIATVATALGIIGLLVRNQPRIAAIIGTTLGASHLLVGVAGIVGAQLVTAVLG